LVEQLQMLDPRGFEPSLLARGDASPESFDAATLNDLLGQRLPEITRGKDGQLECLIPPAAAFALSLPLMLPRALGLRRSTRGQ
jgi:hypothetical protein